MSKEQQLRGWEEEFGTKFNYATFCWNGDNYTGKKFAIEQKKKVKQFIKQVVAQTRLEAIESCIGIIEGTWKLESWSKYDDNLISMSRQNYDAMIARLSALNKL